MNFLSPTASHSIAIGLEIILVVVLYTREKKKTEKEKNPLSVARVSGMNNWRENRLVFFRRRAKIYVVRSAERTP